MNIIRGWLLCIPMVVASQGSQAEAVPAKGAVDPRIRLAVYDPNQVYRLYGYAGYHIDIEFEPDETVVRLNTADPEAITFSARGSVLTLKPKVELVETNLTITTSKRRYYFEYTAAATRPSRFAEPVMYVVRFTYPEQRISTGPTVEESVDAALAQASIERPRNFDYWYCGHRSLRPVATSDDGVLTRITFGSKAELPALFVRNEDGSESLLNFSIQDGSVVIHRIAPRLILRRGKLTGCIVNKGFIGAGERLKSGTVAPAVERAQKELRP